MVIIPVLDILQPCVTYNKHNTYEWFKERVYKLEDVKDYDTNNWDKAFEVSKDYEKKIAIGVIYQDPKSVPYSQRINHRKDVKTKLIDEVKKYSIKEHIGEFE